jgi:hypothetical protein
MEDMVTGLRGLVPHPNAGGLGWVWVEVLTVVVIFVAHVLCPTATPEVPSNPRVESEIANARRVLDARFSVAPANKT